MNYVTQAVARRHVMASAERQEPLVETENRERLEVEARSVLLGPIVRQRQPGPRRGEAGMGRTIPLHRRSNRIAADAERRSVHNRLASVRAEIVDLRDGIRFGIEAEIRFKDQNQSVPDEQMFVCIGIAKNRGVDIAENCSNNCHIFVKAIPERLIPRAIEFANRSTTVALSLGHPVYAASPFRPTRARPFKATRY